MDAPNFYEKFGNAPPPPVVVMIGQFFVSVVLLMLLKPCFVQRQSVVQLAHVVGISFVCVCVAVCTHHMKLRPADTLACALQYGYRAVQQ